jgi:hypothetical protein
MRLPMRLSRRLSAAVAAGAAVAVLTGCAGAPEEPVAEVTSSPSPEPPNLVEVFRAAAVDTEAARASRYTLTTATTVNGTEVVFSGEGIYDWTTETGRVTYEVPAGEVQQRVLGAHLYLALPQQPDVFFDLPTADVAASPVGGTIEPTAQLHMLAAVTEAEVVGRQQVRGTPTTQYRGTYDMPRALRGAQGLQQPALRSLLGPAAGAATAPYDVFIGDDGLLRRLQQTIEVPPSPDTGGQTLTVTTTLDLYDFGIDVRVGRPADKAVRDGKPILEALRQALPQPSPVPSPPPVDPLPETPPSGSPPAAPVPSPPAAVASPPAG